ncbi:MAG: hypothetical protein WEB56_13500 [Roseovarius sp.]
MSVVFALIAALMVAGSGVLRAQASGHLAQTEIELAPLLEMGGTLDDLCAEEGEHCPGCVECDSCCLQLSAPLPMQSALAATRWQLVIAQGAPLDRMTGLPLRAAPSPPARAPPRLI